MEIAKLCKNTYHNQLQESIKLCHKRNMSQIWAGDHTLAEPKLKVTPCRCTLTPLNQCNYQVSTFYTLQNLRIGPDKIKIKNHRQNHSHCNKVKSQTIIPWCYTPTTPNKCPYQLSTSYIWWFLRHCPHRILKVKVTTARLKVKSRSHHDAAYLQPPANVPTKYQLDTPYAFQDITRTRFSNLSKVEGQIKLTIWRCRPATPTSLPTKFKRPKPSSFWDTYRDRVLLPPTPPIQTPWVKAIPWQPLILGYVINYLGLRILSIT